MNWMGRRPNLLNVSSIKLYFQVFWNQRMCEHDFCLRRGYCWRRTWNNSSTIYKNIHFYICEQICLSLNNSHLHFNITLDCVKNPKLCYVQTIMLGKMWRFGVSINGTWNIPLQISLMCWIKWMNSLYHIMQDIPVCHETYRVSCVYT